MQRGKEWESRRRLLAIGLWLTLQKPRRCCSCACSRLRWLLWVDRRRCRGKGPGRICSWRPSRRVGECRIGAEGPWSRLFSLWLRALEWMTLWKRLWAMLGSWTVLELERIKSIFLIFCCLTLYFTMFLLRNMDFEKSYLEDEKF